MSIDELYKAFTDIDFQSNRLLKSKIISEDFLRKFDDRVENVRFQIIKLDLSQDINEMFESLERIDIETDPKLNFGQKVLNVILFGFYKKRVKRNKREKYFREEIQRRKLIFQHVETHLKES